MSSITIRNLSEETKRALADRAAREGDSLENLTRRLLDDAAGGSAAGNDLPYPRNLIAIVQTFGPNLVAEDLRDARTICRTPAYFPVDFNEGLELNESHRAGFHEE